MKAREGQKRAIFPSLIWGGRGGSRFSIYFVQDCNLGQNKMEQQTPIPPKSRMKPREGQKRAIFPSLIWGEGGGSRFSIYFVQDCRSRFLLSLIINDLYFKISWRVSTSLKARPFGRVQWGSLKDKNR